MRAFFALIKSWFQKLISIFKKSDPEDPGKGGPGEVVCYYGCPNSDRARKLQLEKKSYR